MASSTASRGGRVGVWFPVGNWFASSRGCRSQVVSLRNHSPCLSPRNKELLAMTSVVSPDRHKVRFPSGDTTCAAWHYEGVNGGCVVMSGGLAVTKEPATDRLAARFQAAGFSVLALDFRRLGESGGTPRQVVDPGDQQADLRGAIAFARGLPGVDPERVALWGFSMSGGHVLVVGARDARLAAVIAQAPLADGVAATPNGM